MLRIITLKEAIVRNSHRAAYIAIVPRITELDTPGLAAAEVRRFS